jgi:hypothetical protein
LLRRKETSTNAPESKRSTQPDKLTERRGPKADNEGWVVFVGVGGGFAEAQRVATNASVAPLLMIL